MSVLTYALLAQLAREPASGYELSRALKVQVGRFWTAEHSQIYPQLARLERDGLVTVEKSAGPGPRPRKTYTITPAGLDDLRAWAATFEAPPEPNSPLALKLSCAWLLSDDELLGLLTQIKDDAAAQVEAYEGLPAVAANPPRDDPSFATMLTVPIGLEYQRHRLEWAEWALEQVRERRE